MCDSLLEYDKVKSKCFFNDTATTEIYTLSLHDALPISPGAASAPAVTACWSSGATSGARTGASRPRSRATGPRSEEHTSELQSRQYLVCRLLLEIKKPLVLDIRLLFLRRTSSSYHSPST